MIYNPLEMINSISPEGKHNKNTAKGRCFCYQSSSGLPFNDVIEALGTRYCLKEQ